MAVFSWLLPHLSKNKPASDFGVNALTDLQPELERIVEGLKQVSNRKSPAPSGLSDILNLVGRLHEQLKEIETIPVRESMTQTIRRPLPKNRPVRSAIRAEPPAHRIARRLLESGLSPEKVSAKTYLPQTVVLGLLPPSAAQVVETSSREPMMPRAAPEPAAIAAIQESRITPTFPQSKSISMRELWTSPDCFIERAQVLL